MILSQKMIYRMLEINMMRGDGRASELPPVDGAYPIRGSGSTVTTAGPCGSAERSEPITQGRDSTSDI